MRAPTLQTIDRIEFLKNFDQIAANLDAPVGITVAHVLVAIAVSPAIYRGLLELHQTYNLPKLHEDHLLSPLDSAEHVSILEFKRHSVEVLRKLSPEVGCLVLLADDKPVTVLICPWHWDVLASYQKALQSKKLLKELMAEGLKGRELWDTFQLRREDRL